MKSLSEISLYRYYQKAVSRTRKILVFSFIKNKVDRFLKIPLHYEQKTLHFGSFIFGFAFDERGGNLIIRLPPSH